MATVPSFFNNQACRLAWVPAAAAESIFQEVARSLGFDLMPLHNVNENVLIALHKRLAVLLSVNKLLISVALDSLLKSCEHSRLLHF